MLRTMGRWGFDGPVGHERSGSISTSHTLKALAPVSPPHKITSGNSSPPAVVHVSFQTKVLPSTPRPITDQPVAYTPAMVRSAISKQASLNQGATPNLTSQSSVNRTTPSGGRFDGPVGKNTPTVAKPAEPSSVGTNVTSTKNLTESVPAAGKNSGPASTPVPTRSASSDRSGHRESPYPEAPAGYRVIIGVDQPVRATVPEPDFVSCSGSVGHGTAGMAWDRNGNKYLTGGVSRSTTVASGSCEAGYILGKDKDAKSFLEGPSVSGSATAMYLKGGVVQASDGRRAITVGANTAPFEVSASATMTTKASGGVKDTSQGTGTTPPKVSPGPVADPAEKFKQVVLPRYPLLKEQVTASSNNNKKEAWNPWNDTKLVKPSTEYAWDERPGGANF